MAKPKGPFIIKGTLGGLSFYDSVFGPIVRTKGGPTKQQIKKSPAYASVRRNNSEFANAASAGKVLRQGMRALLTHIDDHRLVWRVTQLMVQLKNLDSHSEWGQRVVGKGLLSEAGQHLLKNLDFNSNAPLKTLLKCDYRIDPHHRLHLPDFVPVRDLKFPKGASQVVMKSALLQFDPEGKKTTLTESNTVRLAMNRKSNRVLLAPDPNRTTGGTVIQLLLICFLDENNPSALPTRNKYNGLGVVGVKNG